MVGAPAPLAGRVSSSEHHRRNCWCEVDGKEMRVYLHPPAWVFNLDSVEVTEHVDGGWEAGSGDCSVRFSRHTKKSAAYERMSRRQHEEEMLKLERRRKEMEMRAKELELLWREHAVFVAEQVDEHIPPASAPRSYGSTLSESLPHSSPAHAPESPRHAGYRRILRNSEAPSGVEELEESSSEGEEQAPLPEALEFEVPGKQIRIQPSPEGLCMMVNGMVFGVLTWLGYDARRQWLTTGTASSRAGIAIPDGAHGLSILHRLANVADAAGVDHNLPSETSKVGDTVEITKFTVFDDGTEVVPGQRGVIHCTPHSLSASFQVRLDDGETVFLKRHQFKTLGNAKAARDGSVSDYIRNNLTAEQQDGLESLDDELQGLISLAAEF